MVDDKVDGDVVVAYPTGQVKSVKRYELNVPVGVHTTYSEEGEALEVMRYEGGELVEVNGEPVPTEGD
tara:strand:+ start:560 stop:763 length:204 start_codon:yes stop_codon:yes gene_type:complete